MVPSTVVRPAFNYLLNPDHPEYAQIVVSSPEPFELDPGLLPDYVTESRPDKAPL